MLEIRMRSVAFASLLFAPALYAQTVSPVEFTRSEAPAAEARPLGALAAAGWRYQQIHDDLEGKAMTIRVLRLRRDHASLLHNMAFSAIVQMKMSTARTTSATAKTNFNDNHGTNLQTVVGTKKIEFPATGGGHVPAAFSYEIKLDRPYAFDGRSGLCWEMAVRGHENLLGGVAFDAVGRANSNPPLAVTIYGKGCSHSKRVGAMNIAARSGMNWPGKRGTLALTINELPANGIGIVGFGFSRTRFAAIPLPFVFPGSQTAPSGPCALYASLEFLLGVAADTRGRGTFNLAVPATPDMNGFQLRSQVLAPDTAAQNALGFVSSNAIEANWVAPYKAAPVSTVVAANLVAAIGSIGKNLGMVIQLQ